MSLLDTVMQLNWNRALRVWIFLGATLAACEAAYLFRRAIIAYLKTE